MRTGIRRKPCRAPRTTHHIALLLLVLGLTAPGLASATTTHLYAEVFTSEQAFLVPADIAVRVDLAYAGGPPVALLVDVEPGEGLGDGNVVAGGPALEYTHRFRPASPVEDIVRASLVVSVMDDGFFDGPENLSITIDGSAFASGQATFAIYADTISAQLFENDGRYDVVVTSTQGGFNVLSSFFSVLYTSDDGLTPSQTQTPPRDGTAVPEPVGFTLFSLGAVVLLASRRRWSSPRS